MKFLSEAWHGERWSAGFIGRICVTMVSEDMGILFMVGILSSYETEIGFHGEGNADGGGVPVERSNNVT